MWEYGSMKRRAFLGVTGINIVLCILVGDREVMSRETALAVPPGDPRALAQGVAALLEDEPRRVALGAAARELAEEHYSWDEIARRLAGIYELVAGAPSRVPALPRRRGPVGEPWVPPR